MTTQTGWTYSDKTMSYIKLKSGHFDFSGLKLEESDVDREEICSERLYQLLSMQNMLDSLPLSQNTVASPTKSLTQPSIPSSKATRFGILSKSWNFPKITEFPRQICRSADFYETRFRKPTRYASVPDLPRISKNDEEKSPFILKFTRKDSPQLSAKKDFFIQGRNFRPTEKSEEAADHFLNNETSKSSHIRIPPSTGTAHAPPKSVTPTMIKMSENGYGERNNFEMEFPLTARQCFPSKTQRDSEKSDKNNKNKIRPMERKFNSNFNKYVQSRFGRSLGPSTKKLSKSTHAHLFGIGDWDKHGGEVQKRIGVEAVAMENVVRKIVGCREKDHGNDIVAGQQRLVEFLSCSSLKRNPLTSEIID